MSKYILIEWTDRWLEVYLIPFGYLTLFSMMTL